MHFYKYWMCYINFSNFFCKYVLFHLEWCYRKGCLIKSMYNVSLKVWNTYYSKYWHVYFCWNLHIWFIWKFITKKIDFNTYCLKIHGNTCELNFWSWHYHPIMGPIQNMEAMFQTWKNIVLWKDLHLGLTSSFYCECTLCRFVSCWVNVFVVGAKSVDITHHMPWGLKIQAPTWILIQI